MSTYTKYRQRKQGSGKGVLIVVGLVAFVLLVCVWVYQRQQSVKEIKQIEANTQRAEDIKRRLDNHKQKMRDVERYYADDWKLREVELKKLDAELKAINKDLADIETRKKQR